MEDDSFLNRTIYNAIYNQLYHHYNSDADKEENHTELQKQQQYQFTDLLADTPVIKKLHQFLVCKGMLSHLCDVHWRSCPLAEIKRLFSHGHRSVTHKGLPVITVISHFTQPTRYCCGRVGLPVLQLLSKKFDFRSLSDACLDADYEYRDEN